MALRNLFGGSGGGAVSSSTGQPMPGNVVVTGLVPAGASAKFKKGGAVVGDATVTPQGAASYGPVTLVAGDSVSFAWVLTGETPTATAAVGITAPAAPSIALTAGDGQIRLAWTDGANGGATIDRHGIYRGTTSGQLTRVAIITAGSPYLDTSLTNGQAYVYQITAFNSAGESLPSPEATATPVAATQTNPNPNPTPAPAQTLTAAAVTPTTPPGTELGKIAALGFSNPIASISPNDGRLMPASGGTRLVVGLVPTVEGRVDYTVTSTDGKTAPLALTSAAGPAPSGTLRLSSVLAHPGTVYTATVLTRTIGDTTTAVASDGTALTFIEGIAASQPGIITGTFTGLGRPTITVTNTAASDGTVTTGVVPILVAPAPSVAALADVVPAAQKFLAAYRNRLPNGIQVTANPGTVAFASTSATPSRTPVAIASVPDGDSNPFGNGATWIYGNTVNGQKAYAQGGSKRFRYAGRYLDCAVGAGGLANFRVRIRSFTSGVENPPEWLTLNPCNDTGTASGFINIDLGSYADRVVELIGGELSAASFLGRETAFPITAYAYTGPRSLWLGNSYVFGQGATEVRKSFSFATLERNGVYELFNNGFRTNAWARQGGTQGTHPFLPDRLLGNPWFINELTQNGALELVILTGTINDNTSNVTRLYNQARTTFQRARAGQPTALILYVLKLNGPDARGAPESIQALRDAFNDVLGSDPGALLVDTIAENWIPSGAIGSSPYFPDGSGDFAHPNQAGHTYFASLIAPKLWSLVQRVLTAAGLNADGGAGYSAGGSGGGTPTSNAVLREDGSYLLREDGSRILREA